MVKLSSVFCKTAKVTLIHGKRKVKFRFSQHFLNVLHFKKKFITKIFKMNFSTKLLS